MPRSVPTVATTISPTPVPPRTILVFTTTLPAYLPDYLRSIQLQSIKVPSTRATASQTQNGLPRSADSAAELTASIMGALETAGFPSAAVSKLAPIIVGPSPQETGLQTGDAAAIQHQQQLAAIDAVLAYVLSFFKS